MKKIRIFSVPVHVSSEIVVLQTLKLETSAITTIEHSMYRDASPVARELRPLVRMTTLYSRDVYHEHGKERWLDVDFLIGI